MKSLEDLEKKINSELNTKIKNTEIKHNQIFIEIDKDDILDVVLFLKTVLSTALVLVVAEFLPKTIVQINPNRSLKLGGYPLFIVHVLLYLPSKLILLISDTVLNIGKENKEAVLTTSSWEKIYSFLKTQPRTSIVNRNTSETTIRVSVDLDGNGNSTINTGIGFFDHMLAQIAKHGNLDLSIEVAGDLQIDEHHTIEDVAINFKLFFKTKFSSNIIELGLSLVEVIESFSPLSL